MASPGSAALEPANGGAARAGITRLVIACADQPGIVAAVSAFLARAGANIVSSAQHSTDPHNGSFFMRLEFALELSENDRGALESAFHVQIAEPLEMEWRMWD